MIIPGRLARCHWAGKYRRLFFSRLRRGRPDFLRSRSRRSAREPLLSTEICGRRISGNVVRRALAIFMVSFGVMLLALTALVMVRPGEFMDCLYEVTSAIATVGLSRDLTAGLNTPGRIIIIITMYLGRIGPISLALFFNVRQFVNLVRYPEERVGVG